ncbi:MAG: hypothetical protein U0840_22695 [Gemmataceae bacterium]
MPARPAPDLPSLDRPLSVPLLIRGAIDYRILAALMLLALLFLGLGLFFRIRMPDDSYGPGFFWGMAAAFGLPGLLLLCWQVPRRRWLEVTLSGFVVTERGRRQVYSLVNVMGIARAFRVDSSRIVHHRIRLDLVGDQGPQTIECTYKVPSDRGDPLASFWTRLIASMASRLRGSLARGSHLDGDGWRLDQQGFTLWGTAVLPIAHITRASYIDQHLLLWREDEERPFARLPAWGRNTQPLAAYLQEAIAQRTPGPTPMTGTLLGRVLLDRRNWEWMAGIGILSLSLAAVVLALGNWLTHRPTLFSLDESWPFVVVHLALSILGFTLTWQGWKSHVIFHEQGVAQPGTMGSTIVKVDEIEAITWKPGPHLRIIARADLRRPVVEYRCMFTREDRGLEEARDYLCDRMAQQWEEAVAGGPLAWTTRLRFLPGGLEYTASSLLEKSEPVTVPYHLTSYQIREQRFLLYVAGQEEPVLRERTDGPNFFVGLMLLRRIHARLSHPRESPVSPAEPGQSATGIRSTPATPGAYWQ